MLLDYRNLEHGILSNTKATFLSNYKKPDSSPSHLESEHEKGHQA
jgi:hypothetical protein